ncbi:metabotropic glutamate receptor 4 [Biomphalaria glabrata]|nr:metabotropic glutamate receptor 4 [Biomphalaria glabrata]
MMSLLWCVSKAESLMAYGVNPDTYSRPGDINIGSIMSITKGVNNFLCNRSQIPGSWGIEFPEAIAFAVDAVNRDPNLLPNLTLGFYVLDDCYSRILSLGQSLSFLPRSGHTESRFDNSTCSGTSCPLDDVIKYRRVVGVLAPMLSSSAVPVSYLYTTARLPVVGYSTSTDELSDKTLHPNFLRVISPDKYQALAMLTFIKNNGWSYVSIVYSQGPYGERAFDTIKSSAASFNICLAVTHRVLDSEEMEPVARSILSFPRARAVILFSDVGPTLRLLDYIDKLNATGHFIWITSDSATLTAKEEFLPYKNLVIGMFMFLFYAPLMREFYEYIRRQNVTTSSNPWFKFSYESMFACSISAETCNLTLDVVRDGSFGFMNLPTLLMDAVLSYAHGIHALISTRCPSVSAPEAMDCIQNHSLLSYLRDVSFNGYSGPIRFNSEGDVPGKYVIYQMTWDYATVPFDYGNPASPLRMGLVTKEVAFYDIASEDVAYTSTNISWDHLKKVDRLVPLGDGELDKGIPESVCSRPCVVGEYKIQMELSCCWECRKCRENEKIINQNTSCEECPLFTWPDPQTGFTSCLNIPLTYPTLSQTLTIVQLFLAVFGLAITILASAMFLHYRDSRVIKAASRELSLLQLAAIFTGYVTVVCFQSAPTPTSCAALYVIFCLSFAMLYCPLFVKAVRIFRIFQSSTKNNKRPRFVSPQSQVVISVGLICIQVVLCVVVVLAYTPTSRRTQMVRTERFVELTCDMTLQGLASFLTYNLVLVSLCSIFAFKTRHLPDNFNESKFISMCVSTTLVIWLAFVPTYFTAGREYVRTLLLSVALLLNHTVALVFLFMPKIYAAIYVPSEPVVTTRFNTISTRVHHLTSTNRVAPSPGSVNMT